MKDGVADLETVEIPLKNTVTKRWQLKVNDQPYDLTSQSVYIAIKDNLTSTSYKLDPTTCDIDDAEDGKFSYEFTTPVTDEIYEGVVELRVQIAVGEYRTIGRGRINVTQTVIT